MFTGIVQARGRVIGVEPTPAGARLTIDQGDWGYRPAPGDSVCVSGCCLTAVGGGPGHLAFDVIPETLRLTTLGGLRPGDGVNLEHALTASSLVGGHFVQGHVDGVGEVAGVRGGEEHRVRIRPPEGLMRLIAPKGSVAVEGVSLTVAAVSPGRGWFEVALIPTTLEVTTLGSLREGAAVNLEADMLAKAVVHYMEHYAGR